MRITSGEFRNRVLKTPSGTTTHPMGDRERLALFNALTAVFAGSFTANSSPETTRGPLAGVGSVLDLYSGSGALGLEALSRGAKRAIFVDKDREATEVIKENIRFLGVSDRAKVYKMGASQALELQEIAENRYDLILIDPPYDHFSPEEFVKVEILLSDNGIMVLSFPDSAGNPEEIFPDLTLISNKSYAAANIAIFSK